MVGAISSSLFLESKRHLRSVRAQGCMGSTLVSLPFLSACLHPAPSPPARHDDTADVSMQSACSLTLGPEQPEG